MEIRFFADSKPYIWASFRGKCWIFQPYVYDIGENDIIEYIRNLKGLNAKIANKVIIPIKTIDENAKLLAKELKIAIWDISVMNMLLTLYGKSRIIIL